MCKKTEESRLRAPRGQFTCTKCGGYFPNEEKIVYNASNYCKKCADKYNYVHRTRKKTKTKTEENTVKTEENTVKTEENTVKTEEASIKTTHQVPKNILLDVKERQKEAKDSIKMREQIVQEESKAKANTETEDEIYEGAIATKTKAPTGFFICKWCNKYYPIKKRAFRNSKAICPECNKEARKKITQKTKEKNKQQRETLSGRCTECKRVIKNGEGVILDNKLYCQKCYSQKTEDRKYHNLIMDFVKDECDNSSDTGLYQTIGWQLKRMTSPANKDMKCTYIGIYKTLVYVFRSHRKELKVNFYPKAFQSIVTKYYYDAIKEDEEIEKVQKNNEKFTGVILGVEEVELTVGHLDSGPSEDTQEGREKRFGKKIGLNTLDFYDDVDMSKFIVDQKTMDMDLDLDEYFDVEY